MKIKKIATVFALLMGISTLSGCTNNDQKIIFEPFWNEYSTSSESGINETLVYDVTFSPIENNSFVNYTLTYQDGIYTTKLLSEKVENDIVYTYTTDLSISGQFALGTDVKTFTDTVTSEVKFKATNFGLQPISSKKEINSTSPVGSQVSKIDDCYNFYHYALDTAYLENCTSVKTVITEYPLKADGTADTPNVKELTTSINQEKFTYLDNEQLLAALRCVRNTTTSAKVNVYSPFVNAVQKVSVSFSADATKDFTLSKNGNETKETITYRPASIVLDERNPGATQTAWFAKYSGSNTSNQNRNVMLYLETPLPYSIGTMKYTLKSMNHQ